MLKLKEARAKTGMTQKEAAAKSGIPLGTLRRWEQGVNEPDTDSLVMLADLYGASMDEIIGSRLASSANLTPDESELLELYRASNPQGRAAIMAVARSQQGMEGQSSSHMSATA